MQKRYIPKQPLSTSAQGRHNVVFSVDFSRDGVHGYTADDVAGIPKAVLAELFRVISIDVDEPVETATAGPGEKRQTAPRKTATRKKAAKKT